MFPVSMTFLSGDWLWVEGWIFNVWFIAVSFSSILYLYRKDPALLEERFRKPGTVNQKRWDVYLLYAFIMLFMAWFVTMPLDAKRYALTVNFPLWLKVLGGLGLVPSFFFLYRAYTDNTFVSPLVRIQTERKQWVVSAGVYGIVRHPMYLGGILLFMCAPLLLGSRYGVMGGTLLTILVVVRLIAEESMLVRELEGYEEYKTKVKHRLIPFVW